MTFGKTFVALSRRIHFGVVMIGLLAAGAAQAGAPAQAAAPVASAAADGVIRVKSAYRFDETVTRIEQAVRANKIRFFGEIDQSNLAATAKIPLRPSKLLLFGNPPLGVQLLTANPLAGLDWPVRMLVVQDTDGQVWVAYTDFAFIGHRFAITNRDAVIAMATKVSALVAGSTGR
jgi:uncharacterized protein (DUF302 family)